MNWEQEFKGLSANFWNAADTNNTDSAMTAIERMAAINEVPIWGMADILLGITMSKGEDIMQMPGGNNFKADIINRLKFAIKMHSLCINDENLRIQFKPYYDFIIAAYEDRKEDGARAAAKFAAISEESLDEGLLELAKDGINHHSKTLAKFAYNLHEVLEKEKNKEGK